ncbi:MAG TPA: ATP-binding protein [Methylomirabilota bacterium]|jgi:nitrogen-specific signal transduction histidine kinase
MGLRLRLILVLMIPPILVVGVYGLIRVRTGRDELLADTERTVILVAEAIRAGVAQGLRESGASDLPGTLAEVVNDEKPVDRIRIFDRALNALFVSNRRPAADAVSADVLRRVAETRQSEGLSSGTGRQRLFSYVLPIRTNGRVPAAIQARVFEPFFSTRPPGEGTGLGLPVCRDILEGLRAEITCQSEPAAGATFVVWLAEDGACEA